MVVQTLSCHCTLLGCCHKGGMEQGIGAAAVTVASVDAGKLAADSCHERGGGGWRVWAKTRGETSLGRGR